MKMNSDEEAFHKYIVSSDDEEKENSSDKEAKTTRQQFEMMIEFARECDDQQLSKEEYDRRWVSLAERLNGIGPPIRNSYEWRRVSSVFKYNQKRKQQPAPESIGARRSRQEQPIFVRPPVDRVPVVELDGQQSVSNQILETVKEILSVVRDTNEKVTVIEQNLSR